MNKVTLSGDPGLLLSRKSGIRLPDAGIWPKTDRVIGINWGTAYNKIYGNDEAKVEAHLIQVIEHYIQQGYKIYLYSVWGPDQTKCMKLYHKIGDERNVRVSPRVYNQYELLELMESFAFTINFKLHANVLSYIAKVPFIALGYRFKVFDFGASIQLMDHVLSTDLPDLAQKMILTAERIAVAANRKPFVRRRDSHIQSYKSLLKHPFALF